MRPRDPATSFAQVLALAATAALYGCGGASATADARRWNRRQRGRRAAGGGSAGGGSGGSAGGGTGGGGAAAVGRRRRWRRGRRERGREWRYRRRRVGVAARMRARAGGGWGGGAAGAGGSGGGGGGASGRGGAGGSGGAGGRGRRGGGGGAGSSGRGGAIAGASGTGGVTAASDGAPVFDGTSGYVEIPDDNLFSEPTSGAITVEAWMRPDSTAMPRDESGGYVHWMGKGVSGQHEWVARMYQDGNSEGRENRISFYSFNLTGGLGAGSYFQDTVTVGGWIHYAGEFDDVNTYIFKNGVLRDMDPLSGYSIEPGNGTAPVRIGTRDFNSFFQGSVARVAIYSTRLPAATLVAHYAAADAAAYDAMVLAEPSLVGYWRLDDAAGTVAVDARGGHDGSYHGGVTLRGATWRR